MSRPIDMDVDASRFTAPTPAMQVPRRRSGSRGSHVSMSPGGYGFGLSPSPGGPFSAMSGISYFAGSSPTGPFSVGPPRFTPPQHASILSASPNSIFGSAHMNTVAAASGATASGAGIYTGIYGSPVSSTTAAIANAFGGYDAASKKSANGGDGSDETISQACSYENLGNDNRDRGQYTEAIEYFGKALGIRVRQLGADHPSVATTYMSLGVAFFNMGDHDQAIRYYEGALAIFVTQCGKDHPDVASTYNNLANAYAGKDDYDTAVDYYSKALDMLKGKVGDDHPMVAGTYNNIAVAYRGKGDYAKAVEHYDEALARLVAKLGENHPMVMTTYNSLADTYLAAGRQDEAIFYYQKGGMTDVIGGGGLMGGVGVVDMDAATVGPVVDDTAAVNGALGDVVDYTNAYGNADMGGFGMATAAAAAATAVPATTSYSGGRYGGGAFGAAYN